MWDDRQSGGLVAQKREPNREADQSWQCPESLHHVKPSWTRHQLLVYDACLTAGMFVDNNGIMGDWICDCEASNEGAWQVYISSSWKNSCHAHTRDFMQSSVTCLTHEHSWNATCLLPPVKGNNTPSLHRAGLACKTRPPTWVRGTDNKQVQTNPYETRLSKKFTRASIWLQRLAPLKLCDDTLTSGHCQLASKRKSWLCNAGIKKIPLRKKPSNTSLHILYCQISTQEAWYHSVVLRC